MGDGGWTTEQGGATGLLLAALVLNLGWLWVPLGVAALVAVSWGTHRMVRDRWPAWLQAGLLAVAWLPLLYVVLASGLTVGAGGRPLFAIGGSQSPDVVRAVSGVVVPLLVAGQLWAWRPGLVQTLAAASLVLWVVGAPASLFLGEHLGPDLQEVEDPADLQAPSGVLEVLVVTPFLAAYGLAVAAAGVAWHWERSSVPGGDRQARPG